MSNFMIWSYLDGLIRMEETNILLKTYTHRCEPERFSVQARNLAVFEEGL